MEKNQARGVRAFLFLFFLVGLGAIGFGGWNLFRSLQSTRWPTVEGVVLTAEVKQMGLRAVRSDGAPTRELVDTAAELAIPVIPVRIDGLERVLPRGAHWPQRGRVVVTFGEPLRLAGQAVDAIVEQSRDAVASLAEHR